MRLLLAIACLTLLSACNMVITQTPLFTKADEVGAPPLRNGIWVETPAATCALDETKPLADWPNCAQAWVVKDGVAGGFQMRNGQRVWSSTEIIVAGGDPRVLQIHLSDSGSGEILMPQFYLYGDLKPLNTDGQGRIVAYQSWLALCGPPPPKDAKTADGKGQRLGTLSPLPGLTMDKSGDDCTTASQDVVRAAAKASQAWNTDTSASHWVRDGDK